MNTFNNKSFKLKKYLPKDLLRRFLLITLIPIVLMQLIYIVVFINNYWEKVNKKSVNVLLQEVIILNKEFNAKIKTEENITKVLEYINSITTMNTKFIENGNFSDLFLLPEKKYKTLLVFDPAKEFKNGLIKSNIQSKKYFRQYRRYFEFCTKKENGYFCIEIPIHRIIPRSISSFVMWSFCPAMIIGLIVFLFTKNQIKSIKNLTKSMNEFSILEKENENFKPSGATEIREMGIAFLKMQKQIKKYISNKTLMFAEISHDLRTPLTRMKLETEFIDDSELKENLKHDINEMEKMINDYLCFARGEKDENFEDINIKEYFNEIIAEYKRGGYNTIQIKYNIEKETFRIKKFLFKRAINNIINNSLKHAKNIKINIFEQEKKLHINISDDGCGINEDILNNINNSFYKIETDLRNEKSFGLGLAIIKKIIYAHGGELIFNNIKTGGFLVEIIL